MLTEKIDNKKDTLFVISQLCVLLNCYICFLGIYEDHLQPLSWILIPLAFVCFFLSSPISTIKGNTIAAIEICLFVYVSIGELVHSNFHRLGSRMMLSVFVFFFFMTAFYSSQDRARYSYKAVLESIAFLSAAVAVTSFFYFIAFRNSLSDNEYLKGVTVNRNHLGMFSSIGAMAAIVLAGKGRNKFFLVNIVFAVVNIVCLIFTQSRAAMLAFFVMVFFYMVYFISQLRSRLAKLLIVVTFIIVGIWLMIFIFKRNNINTGQSIMNMLNSVSSSRISIWTIGFDIAIKYPWLGASGTVYDGIFTERIGYSISQHNVFLNLASENGIPAALLYFALLLTSFVQGIITIKKTGKESRYEAFMLIGMLVGCSVADLLDTYSMALHIPNAFLVFFVIGQIQYRYFLCKKI